jgi:hypothetical protein
LDDGEVNRLARIRVALGLKPNASGNSSKATASSWYDDEDPTAIPPELASVDAWVADRLLAGIDDIDWSSLRHAYGPATTTPDYLRALLATDPFVRDQAIDHLCSAVTHQGTVYSATAAAAPFLLAILADDAGRPVRVDLLVVVEAIAKGSSYHDVHGQFYPADERESAKFQALVAAELADTAACRRAVLDGFDLVLGFLTDPVENVRRQATSTALALASLPEATDAQRAATRSALTALAADDQEHATLAASVLSLALLGADVRTWLEHPALPVRTAAALAPSLRDDPAAHAVLLDALGRGDALDESLPDGYPQLTGYPRFAVIGAVCDRVLDRAAALPSLLAALGLASNSTVDADRGPMLAYFFGPETAGTTLTAPQREFLEALLARDDLWDPQNGNAHAAFRRAALPYDREAIAKIVASGTWPTPPK